MNYILFGKDSIASFSNTTKAESHKHWMLQIFLSLDGEMIIEVSGKPISFECIIINSNRVHKIDSAQTSHFTMLLDNTSTIGKQLKKVYLQNKDYHLFHASANMVALKNSLKKLDTMKILYYEIFIQRLFQTLNINTCVKPNYDSRIHTALKAISTSQKGEISLQSLAHLVALSKSRLSHLFKAETGTPLKSYLLLHRLRDAYSYLLEYRYDITTSAMKAGFDSPSHFAATSKKITGMSASNISKDSVFLKVSFP
ncbi:hypothetical protein CAI16_07490 [Virgibacillus dokdonensis]|uniref:HTH araC/xylS-type domain-containing protein n=1 Tax=Virgibacillus dokdonensis TaxID=302167 RepID=A0A3E0WS04_9BACI|nr:helix-turn-helix transcriptional regulator [Virgibacillus dokdonensis]RFA35628.1 hypothetical protein CAI16_07490 [Virgibacillus dokdonensis]